MHNLSRKQLWRKCVKKERYNYKEHKERSQSPINIFSLLNFDEEESIFHDSKPKNVSFDRIVNVTLIPTVNEYIDNNLVEIEKIIAV